MTDLRSSPDEALIVRIAGGDRDAFALLYRQCRSDVYRFAVHMCNSPAVAEDVVQDVFVAVITDASRYRPGQSGVLPWLLGIARNHVRRFRSQRAILPLPDEETRAGQALAVERDPLIELTRQRHDTALRYALQALPPRYREAIVLCDLQELSYDAAAKALGCAIGTVRSRLHRGRARLARSLCAVRNDVVSRDTGRSRSTALPQGAGLKSCATGTGTGSKL
jgi:RNA polymerase sigma-70 factor (ECF subfamily)